MPELRERHSCHRGYYLGFMSAGIAVLVSEQRLRRILTRMLDEHEALSPEGIRALSESTITLVPTLHRQCRSGIPGELSSGGVRYGQRRYPQLARLDMDAEVNAILIRALLRSTTSITVVVTTSQSNVPPARAS